MREAYRTLKRGTGEHDDFLLAMYHCEPTMFSLLCDEYDCERVAWLNENRDDGQIIQAIERYNLRTFGVTCEDCKAGKCLGCVDIDICPERNDTQDTHYLRRESEKG